MGRKKPWMRVLLGLAMPFYPTKNCNYKPVMLQEALFKFDQKEIIILLPKIMNGIIISLQDW
jgi:hypothetical protein